MNLRMKFQVESQSSIRSSRCKVSMNCPPASLQDWLDEELERRGIDAVIYTRYILSILLQDGVDEDNGPHEDICSYYFCNDRKLKNCPCTKKKSCESFMCNLVDDDGDQEERKKSAAVQCLKSVSDEKYGIEQLVEDLCAKLKEFQLENENGIKDVQERQQAQQQRQMDDLVSPEPLTIEEQAKKYYAAFPALSDTSTKAVIGRCKPITAHQEQQRSCKPPEADINDDELLAKFIDKFNGNTMASIWNSISFGDVWSASASTNSMLDYDWFGTNICFSTNYLDKDYDGQLAVERTPRKISLTLSENGYDDDFSFISHICQSLENNCSPKITNCLLTSDKTHFRPIRQESVDDDAANCECTSPVNALHSESRDSWSPDMKDCFGLSQTWDTSYPSCSVPSSSPSDLASSDKDDTVPANTSWSPLSYAQPATLTLDQAKLKKCDTPLTIDVGPWHNNGTTQVWSDYASTSSERAGYWADKGYDLTQSKWSGDGSSVWPAVPRPSEGQGCDLVSALRDEIKEETEQLFDDIQDMVNAEECDDNNVPSAVIGCSVDHAAASLSPNHIIFSSDLEAEWIKDSLHFNVQTPKLKDKTSTKNHRRPCSFFLEGNCRRTDCKFSHDLSTITCRFWEESCCFKGITCPFLHGYAYSSEESDADRSTPQIPNKDKDFPGLVSTSTNNTPVESDIKIKKVHHKIKKKRRKKNFSLQNKNK